MSIAFASVEVAVTCTGVPEVITVPFPDLIFLYVPTIALEFSSMGCPVRALENPVMKVVMLDSLNLRTLAERNVLTVEVDYSRRLVVAGIEELNIGCCSIFSHCNKRREVGGFKRGWF